VFTLQTFDEFKLTSLLFTDFAREANHQHDGKYLHLFHVILR